MSDQSFTLDWTTFEKVDKTFCFCPNEGDWLKEPDLRESEAFKFALNRLRETALVLSQKVPKQFCALVLCEMAVSAHGDRSAG